MSIRNALLSIISIEPCGVNQLRQTFEERTNHTWPVNVGQVYQTIRRLHRDGFIEHIGTESGTAGKNAEIYQITDTGRQALVEWWRSPTLKTRDDRDELVIKVAMNALLEGNTLELIQQQREATMSELREIIRIKAKTTPTQSAERLLLERKVFELEAETRWLDHIETLASPKDQRS
ncbi:MAG: PadR family transcriptional regulator [Corynebacterium sp.]|nr:PadR family transcriptional regulator [Corynebacterium sp.]